MATQINIGQRGAAVLLGIMDLYDECPDLAQGPGEKKGCPLARVKDDQTAIAAPIDFETDRAIIKDTSKPVLESVLRVLHERPDIRLVEIQGHTDVRAANVHGIAVSGLRAKSVRQYLIDHGVDASRLSANGYGYMVPISKKDDSSSSGCSVLTREGVLKKDTVLEKPNTILPNESSLPSGGAILPKGGSNLPRR